MVQSAAADTVGVLVAGSDIALGKRIGAEDLRWEPWPKKLAGSQFIRQSSRADAVAQLTGTIARASFSKGEPIMESKLAHGEGSGYLAALLAPGTRAVSIDITPATSVNGFVQPNDHVDVVLTSAEKQNGAEFFTNETVLANVTVVAIDDKTGGANGAHTMPGKMATLALTPEQARSAAMAQRLGNLSLVLRSASDPTNVSDNHADCDSRIGPREEVAVIRYGMPVRQFGARPAC